MAESLPNIQHLKITDENEDPLKDLVPTIDIGTIVNGMLPIEFTNLDEFIDIDNMRNIIETYEFTLTSRFKFKTPQKHYPQNKWKSTKLSIYGINSENKFVLKVPLFLLPYTLEFNVSIRVNQAVIDDEGSYDPDEESNQEYTVKIEATSINTMVEIPSILIESEFHINDHIQYCVANAGFVRSGTILEKCPNDHYKIQTDDGYEALNYEQDIVIIHKSQIYRYPTEGIFVVDITNRNQAINDLILRQSDCESIGVYESLCECSYDFYYCECYEFEDETHHFKHMSCLFAINIFEFLYDSAYKYKIQCVLGDSFLFVEEQWKYHILRTIMENRNGIDMHEIQSSRRGFGYTCDICRMELSWYEHMYHCGCGHQHDFCVTCVHSIMGQHEQMTEYISKVLNNKIDNDCIQEIVAFCVGKVIQFEP